MKSAWFPIERLALSVAWLVACIAGSTAPALTGQSLYTHTCQRNPSLSAYTFHMNVTLAMQHFPWLHFHIAGTGQNVRGRRYMVRFNKMPFFARGFENVDLSALDPRMWRSKYIVRLISQTDTTTIFSLRPRGAGQVQKSQLTNALVTLDRRYATRSVALHYANGGTITLDLTPESTFGYWLPATGEAQIDMPGEVLSAHATMTGYVIVPRRDVASAQTVSQ